MNKVEKYFFYSINSFYFLLLGLLSGIFHSALPALTIHLNTNLTEISYGLSMQAFFSCFGSLLGTYFLEKFNRQLLFAFSLIFMSLLNLSLPICTSLNIFYALSSIGGIIGSFIGPIPYVWTAELFKKNKQFYLQLLFLNFSIGEFLSPLLCAPFLPSKSSSSVIEQNDLSNLYIPFLIISVFEILLSASLFIAYFIKPYQDKKKDEKIELKEINDKDGIVEKEKKVKPQIFIIWFVIIISIVFSFESGASSNFSIFLSSFLLKLDYGFTQQQTSYALMVYSGANLLGKGLSCLAVFKIKEKSLIYFNFFMILSANLLLLFLGLNFLTVLWFSIFIIGLGYSSSIPLIYCFVEKNIGLTYRTTSIMSFSSNVFSIINRTVSGYYLNSSAVSFLNMNLIYNLIMIVFFVVLNIYKKKFD